MASRCHGNKCSYRLLPVCGGETRWASSVRRKWKMKRKMEVNYIRSYPGLGAAVTQYNGHYWQAAKTHSVQCRAVLSQRLYASAIYMQFLFFFFFWKKSLWRSKTKKLRESLIVSEESCVTCYSVQFAYLARSAMKHYRTKLLLQHWLWQLFWRHTKDAGGQLCVPGRNNLNLSVCVWERERFFECVANYLYVNFTVHFFTWAEIAAMCISLTHLSDRRSFSGCNYLSLVSWNSFPYTFFLSGAFSISFHFRFRFNYSAI